jgi:hypothetical protein
MLPLALVFSAGVHLIAIPPPVRPDTPCTIHGLVTLDGAPAASGVAVHMRHEMDWQVLETRTSTVDQYGAYRFEKLAPGWYRISAFHKDAMPQAAGSWYCEGFGKMRAANLALKRGGELIEGSVTDKDGAALAGTWASVNNAGANKSIDGSALIPVDKQGRFSVRVVDGFSYNFFATAPGHRFGSFSVHARDDLRQTVGDANMKLMREPFIRGVVVDDKGKPVAGATVFRGPFGAKSPPETVMTGADGAFVMPGMLEIDHVVTARKGAFVGTVNVGRLAEASDADARIALTRGRTLRGTLLLTPSNAVVPLGEVFVRTPHGLFLRVQADMKGRFTFEGLPPRGDIEVRALQGKMMGWQLVPQGVDDIEVKLTPPE